MGVSGRQSVPSERHFICSKNAWDRSYICQSASSLVPEAPERAAVVILVNYVPWCRRRSSVILNRTHSLCTSCIKDRLCQGPVCHFLGRSFRSCQARNSPYLFFWSVNCVLTIFDILLVNRRKCESIFILVFFVSIRYKYLCRAILE